MPSKGVVYISLVGVRLSATGSSLGVLDPDPLPSDEKNPDIPLYGNVTNLM